MPGSGTRRSCFPSMLCAARQRSALPAFMWRPIWAARRLSRLDAALIFEELAKGCTSTAAYISIHNMVCWMIDAYGSTELRQRFLPGLCEHGKVRQLLPHRTGFRLGCGRLKTRAVRQDDDYILDGTKAFISGGGASDVYLVMARTGEAGPGRHLLFSG